MSVSNNQKIILVSGAPGVGKTTLAVPLAKALNFTLIMKDAIKETLYDALNGRPNDIEFSKKIGAAAWEILWKQAETSPRVILESNFRSRNPIEQARLRTFDAKIVEVHCVCPPNEIIQRYNTRDELGYRHPAHALHRITAAQVGEFEDWMGIGSLIEVDTSQDVDLGALVKQINQLLG